TLNDRPDYFGATVNVASRVQGLSRGGDIVFTETLRADPEAQAVLGDCPLESDSVTLKGIGEAVAVHRLAID
ncbi:MAG: adenylate/guanylate cyclase domain-containing protein, partial [Chloroflexi bacterium]|nr:adenylate/guanylate cyclase domain-containing protein [Chloroflexota bacterium]